MSYSGQGASPEVLDTNGARSAWAALPYELIWGATNASTSNLARFLNHNPQAAIITTDIDRYMMRRSGSFRRLVVRQGTAGGSAGVNNTYAVRVNGVVVALTLTVANDSTATVEDNVNEVAYVSGDEVSVQVTKDGAPAVAAQDVVCSLEY